MTKYKVWRVENKEDEKMAKYGEIICGRKMAKYGTTVCGRRMAYLGHMRPILNYVKC